jgi:hypothetical protein
VPLHGTESLILDSQMHRLPGCIKGSPGLHMGRFGTLCVRWRGRIRMNPDGSIGTRAISRDRDPLSSWLAAGSCLREGIATHDVEGPLSVA